MNPEDLVAAAFDVCTALEESGITAVLTGGSAATFYAPSAYQSDDIDFVLVFVPAGAAPAGALSSAGFSLDRNKQLYHRGNVIVEFPPGPLSIGSEILSTQRHATFHRGKKTLKVLTPTDAVRNRLESYYAWNDFSARAAAGAVALVCLDEIDFDEIRAWTLREYERVHDRQRERFNEFVCDVGSTGAKASPLINL